MSATTEVCWDIDHCPLANKCRARWQRLEPVQGDEAVRYCQHCERAVYLCRPTEEYKHHTGLGRCVALEVLHVGVPHVGQAPGGVYWESGRDQGAS